MAKNKNDYFALIESQMSFGVEAARMSEEILCNYSASSIAGQQEKMHIIEQKADSLQHDILTKLSTEFITPIDQEDILRLVQIIDDIIDELDEGVLGFYMYHLDQIPEYAVDLAKVVGRCVDTLYAAVKELKNFKKPANLSNQLLLVNKVEGEADNLFTEAMHNLFAKHTDAKTLIGGKAIYESFENCCDLCEHAADVIAQIIIKNT